MKVLAWLSALVAILTGSYSLMGIMMVASMSDAYSAAAARRDMNLWGVGAIVSLGVLAICVLTLVRQKRA
jgi:cellobiose-specific phosphotransferase system component IIC